MGTYRVLVTPPMKRRHFLATGSAAAFASTFLGSCGRKYGSTLTVFIWADYLNPDLAKRFEREFQCNLVLDTFDSNEAMFAKLKAGAGGYDVLVPSSYMVKTLHREGMLQALDPAAVPNTSHIDREHLRNALDPAMDHSVPYMSAPTCLAYLKSKVKDPVQSWSMLDRADLNRVMMGAASFDQLAEEGKARFEGDRAIIHTLRDLMVTFTPDFEILPGTAPTRRQVPPGRPFVLPDPVPALVGGS